MNFNEKEILTLAEHNFDYVLELRRYFHKNPELSAKEYKTAERIEKELDTFGITHKRVGETCIYAEIIGNKKSDKSIILRADIDALPVKEDHICEYTSTVDGVMHACGHDSHTAELLLASKILSENKDKFGGKIKLMFQAGEEIGYGAKLFAKEGFIKDADRAFAVHCAPDVKCGQVIVQKGANYASVDYFKITFYGKSAHIAKPKEGIDTTRVMGNFLYNIEKKFKDEQIGKKDVLLGIGKAYSGTSYNVIANHAELEGTIRAFSETARAKTKANLIALANRVSSRYGAKVEFLWQDNASILFNNEKASDEAIKVGCELVGKENVLTKREKFFAGEDFAEFASRLTSVYVHIGSGNENIPETNVPQHNSHFDIDEKSLIIGSAFYTAYAVKFLNGEL